MEILDNVGEADVVLHARENYEILAYFVAFRTNSTFARCFLDSWIEEGESNTMPNFDNGDLMRLVLRTLDAALARQCDLVHDDFVAYVHCFAQLYPKIIENAVDRVPLKILFPLEGMTRCYEGKNNGEWSNYDWASTCLASDIFLHGLKTIGEEFYDEGTYSCHHRQSSRRRRREEIAREAVNARYLQPQTTLPL